MKNDMARVLIETVFRKTLKDLKDSPERSIRNTVDMALDFSEGRFQRNFFKMAETMLKNMQSPYYDIIKDGAAHIDEERLFHFGMNLGYNSCIVGAGKIRENEKALGFNIPWTISLKTDSRRLEENPESYDDIINQGEELGIYMWMLSHKGDLREVLPIVQNHTDSAFVLFCEPEDLKREFLDDMSDVKHMMLIVHYKENTQNLYRLLRERGLLYSVFYVYTENEAENIINGDLFYDTLQLHTLFTAVIPGRDCSEETGERVYKAITEFRKNQTFKTIAIDINCDNKYIDGVISNAACPVGFDSDGSLYIRRKTKVPLCIFEQSLSDILRQVFPKQA